MLLDLALFSSKGKPIQCWTPQEFTRSWEEYAENYCWVASTYYIPSNQHRAIYLPIGKSGFISTTGNESPIIEYQQRMYTGRFILYYQWAPILLAVQALLFYIPCLIWRLFAPRSGFQATY
ncbi:unnamed protein product [Protopolystoma xenopodis]|uniref:Innexin n=1 Tax=Protopolystoma xenopodis TaxID=117903 RepID=A0A448XJG2_9PLAT|nr:unnamed protein product [Protopolystoma xenopodis]